MEIIKKRNADPRVDKMKQQLRATKALNLILDDALLRDFKAKAAKEGVSMTDILTKAIQFYVYGE